MWMSAKYPPAPGTYVTCGVKKGGRQLTKWNGEKWGRKGVLYWQVPEHDPEEWKLSETEYLNTNAKQDILLIMAMRKAASYLCGRNIRNGQAVKPILEDIQKLCTAIKDIMIAGTNSDQAKAVDRIGENSTIRVVPTGTKFDEDWVIVDTHDINLLATLAVENAECQLCQADTYHVKKCELRKLLLRAGATMQNDTLDCPFKGV